MGMYPLCPGVPEYVIGSPMFQRMNIQLEDGKHIVIESDSQRKDRPYVQSVLLNNEPHRPLYFTHDQLMNGALIDFALSDTPNRTYIEDQDLPFSMSIQRGQQ
jgi:putative alpha-1,2-mannosidase